MLLIGYYTEIVVYCELLLSTTMEAKSHHVPDETEGGQTL